MNLLDVTEMSNVAVMKGCYVDGLDFHNCSFGNTVAYQTPEVRHIFGREIEIVSVMISSCNIFGKFTAEYTAVRSIVLLRNLFR